MKVYFAADHAGFALKQELLNFARGELGCEIEDCGALVSDSTDDYPDIISRAASAIVADAARSFPSRAIILGGSGQGEAMVANRFKGVRAAVFYGGDLEIVRLSRQHNDANCLSLGARFLSVELAKEAVRIWITTPFSREERHARRVKRIDEVA